LSDVAWAHLSAILPEGALLAGLTSIHWREAWKYGERAFRYCHLDVGHAIGAVALGAQLLGWQAQLVPATGGVLALLLGVHTQEGVEAEHPDCLIALLPRTPHAMPSTFALPAGLRDQLAQTVLAAMIMSMLLTPLLIQFDNGTIWQRYVPPLRARG